MKILKASGLAAIILFVLWDGIAAVPVYAEDSAGTVNPAANPSVSAHGQGRLERVAYLKKLKEENPEAFKQAVQERKEKVKERLRDLKEKNPEKFQQVKQRLGERRREELRRLKQENPEKFRQMMENRREKVRQWKKNNPERFEQFLKKHPKAAERTADRHEVGQDNRETRGDRQGRRGDVRHLHHNNGVRDHGAGTGRPGNPGRGHGGGRGNGNAGGGK